MEGRGGCCIARYSGNGDGGEINYGMSKVDRILLKFRPIAPKPMTSGSGSGSISSKVENNGGTRRKRKYVRVNGKNNKKNTNTSVSKKRTVSNGGEKAVTLPLMPETPDRKENEPTLLSFNNDKQTDYYDHMQGQLISVNKQKMLKNKSEIISFVTMERVTETWLNGDVLGFTDQAKVISLEMDTCPSFITNCKDMVVWSSKAYREMTGCSNETVVVKKCNRVTMPVTQTAFTCKMKVTWGMENGLTPSTLTAPCDVVRLRSGGFAWRLDVNAALCLGR